MAVVYCLSVVTEAQTKQPIIEQFLQSNEFGKIKKQVAALGTINTALSAVRYLHDNKEKPVIAIAIEAMGQVSAVIEVVPIPASFDNLLPNNDRYAMQLIDYTAYSIKLKTGVIKVTDLNYDSYLAAVLDVKQAAIVQFDAFPIPVDIKQKYAGVKKVGGIVIAPDPKEIAKKHFCDKNGNGNVTFGECMGCMQSACNGAATCATMCWLVNVGGIGTSLGGQCTISMGAACIYLSIAY